MNKNALIIIIVASLALLGFFILNNGPNNSIVVNEDVPNFKEYKGHLDDYNGRVAVVNSWATWCPFCVNELPDFVEIQKEFGDEIVVIAINRKESDSRTKSFLDDLGISLGDIEFLNDSSDSFYSDIGGFSMPETLFLDKNGKVLIHKRGVMTIEEIRKKVKESLRLSGLTK